MSLELRNQPGSVPAGGIRVHTCRRRWRLTGRRVAEAVAVTRRVDAATARPPFPCRRDRLPAGSANLEEPGGRGRSRELSVHGSSIPLLVLQSGNLAGEPPALQPRFSGKVPDAIHCNSPQPVSLHRHGLAIVYRSYLLGVREPVASTAARSAPRASASRRMRRHGQAGQAGQVIHGDCRDRFVPTG